MNNNIFFIAGIHGVGKTTLCAHISKKYNIVHYSASTLISEAKKSPFMTLYIKDIDKNQIILVNVVYEKLDRNDDYILDGHFCLLNESKCVERVPQKTFELLGIKKIIVLTENTDIIYNRLRSRLGVRYSKNMLHQLQENELNYSRQISLALNIPYIVLNLSDIDEKSLNKKLDSIFDKKFDLKN